MSPSLPSSPQPSLTGLDGYIKELKAIRDNVWPYNHDAGNEDELARYQAAYRLDRLIDRMAQNLQ